MAPVARPGTTAAAAAGPVLELRNITKTFPGVRANDRVSLHVGRGEVLGVLGENGAGKSTLMNVISGLVRPDGGEIRIDGQPAEIASPRDAIARGIGMVHQHFMLVPTLTVAENVVLGDARLPAGRLDPAALGQQVRRLGEEVGLRVDPDALVGDLDVGQRQRVELVKALYRDARILILDEPTAVLSPADSKRLYGVIRSLADRGVAVILISHRLDDIYAVCDRAVVMREGKVVGDTAVSDDLPRTALVDLMVGTALADAPSKTEGARGAVLLQVAQLGLRRPDGRPILEDVSFTLHEGEILALAGVEGNGQQELVAALCGLADPISGTIAFTFGAGSTRRRARALRRAGLGHVPADRHVDGIVSELALSENVLLTHVFSPTYNRLGWLRRRAAERATAELIETFDIRASGQSVPIETLSGGNQQKLVLARELAHAPKLLVAANPTRGLDIRTIAFVQNRLLAVRDAGQGVLLVSSDLSEIWQIADRVMVAARGRIRGPVALADTDLQTVGQWMAA